jgi:glutamate racemase
VTRNCIGIFDSGIGGLTVMRSIIDLMPNEDIIYFGDTARLPYGGKSPDTIVRYSTENTIFLMEKNIKALVIACNTASSYAVDKLQRIFNIPVIGVIEPGITAATKITKNGRIGVLGTKATILSETYQKGIKKVMPEAEVFSAACPLLVHLVEELLINHDATQLIVKEYLKDLQLNQIDTLMLGCTHYPLLKQVIQKEIGDSVTLVDSATTCAYSLKEVLHKHNIAAKKKDTGKRSYFVSDDPKKFQTIGKEFLGLPIEKVELYKQ